MALQYIEDYLEFLYGSMSKEGVGAQSIPFHSPVCPIKLATYDRSPVTSMGSFCFKARIGNLETCLTDRQLDLAKKIIFKYQRQLSSIGILLPSSPDDLMVRHQVRTIDRSKTLSFDEEKKKLFLRFPYDPKKISSLHDYSPNGAGKVEWNNQDKVWEFDYTEGNLKTILELFKDSDLKFDDQIEPAIVDMLKASVKDLPTFAVHDSMMKLVNCHPSVYEHLEKKNYRENDIDNLSTWTAIATSLGLEIDPSVSYKLEEQYGLDVASIITNRVVTLPSNNQPTGPWYDTLLKANSALKDHNWVLHLTWWTSQTIWHPFQNLVNLSPKEKNSYRLDPVFVETLHQLENPIVILDSVISRDTLRNFVEQTATKIIYISDIGKPL